MTNRSISLGDYVIKDEGDRVIVEHEDSGEVWSFALDPGNDPDSVLRAVDTLLQEDLDLHASDSDAHHTRYTDAEAQAAFDAQYAAEIHGDEAHSEDYIHQAEFDTHEGDASVHHTKYTDTEARAAAEELISGLAEDPHGNEAHRENFVIEDALTSYATNADLDDHETATSGVHGVGTSGIASQDDISTHSGDASAHHTRYTDAEAVDAVEADLGSGYVSSSGDLMSGPLEVDSDIAQLQLLGTAERFGIHASGGLTFGRMSNGAIEDASSLRWTDSSGSWELYRNNDKYYHEGNLDAITSISVSEDGTSADVTELVFDTNISLTDDGQGTATIGKDAYTEHPAISEPGAPSSGLRVFADSADGTLKVKDSSGNVSTVGSDGSVSGAIDAYDGNGTSLGSFTEFQTGSNVSGSITDGRLTIDVTSGDQQDFGSATDPVSSITNTHYREVTNEASVSGNYTIDLETANVHHLTVTGDTSLSLTGHHNDLTTSCTLVIEQDATGGHSITWPTTLNWPNGEIPDLSNGAGDMHRLVMDNVAGTWFGMIVGEMFDSQWEEGEIDFFERDVLDYYSGDLSGYSISTAQSIQGESSLAITSSNYTQGIASHPGDGLPNYPGMGDTFQYYLYPQPSYAGMVTFAIPDGSLPHENGYYIRYDASANRLGVGYEESTNHAEIVEDTSTTLPTGEWVRIEVTRDLVDEASGDISIDVSVYNSAGTLVTSLSGVADSSAGYPTFGDGNRGIGMSSYSSDTSPTFIDGLEVL